MVFCLSADAISQRKSKKKVKRSESKSEYYFTEAEKYFILEDFAKSIALFQKAAEYDPENAAAYYKIAEINLKNSNYDEALENATKSLELEKYKYTYLLLADIYNEMGDLERSADVYVELIENIPGNEKKYFDLAAIYLYQDKLEQALQAYNEIERVYGVSEDIAFQKQRIYQQLGQEDKARMELENLLKRFPDNEYYAVSFAEFLLNMEERNEAIDMLSDFLVEYPESPRVSLLLGEIFRNDNKYTEAEMFLLKGFLDADIDINQKAALLASYKAQLPNNQLQKLIKALCIGLTESFPEESMGHAIYGDFLQEIGESKQAVDSYEMALSITPDNFSIWQNLLLIETELANYDNVIDHSEEALEYFPNQGIIYYLNGYALLRKKMYNEAVFILEEGKRLVRGKDKEISDFNSLLGEAYNGLKEYDKSDDAFQAVLEYEPNNYLVINNYAYYLALRKDNLELAEKMSEKLVKNNPDNVTFLDTHAWVLFVKGKYKEAKKVILKAINTNKTTAVHYEHFGDILYKLGDVDEAVIQWQKAKGMDSNLHLIDKKIADRKLYEK